MLIGVDDEVLFDDFARHTWAAISSRYKELQRKGYKTKKWSLAPIAERPGFFLRYATKALRDNEPCGFSSAVFKTQK